MIRIEQRGRDTARYREQEARLIVGQGVWPVSPLNRQAGRPLLTVNKLETRSTLARWTEFSENEAKG